jgi:hypothetical protein
LSNVDISARIKELQTRITDAVIAKVVLDRVRRIAILEDSVNRKLALREYRAAMYAHHLGESRTWVCHDEAEEKQALAEGFSEEKRPDKPVAPGYPRTLYHPGFPIGGATGLLIKDYRGKNAEQEIWKMDTGTDPPSATTSSRSPSRKARGARSGSRRRQPRCPSK